MIRSIAEAGSTKIDWVIDIDGAQTKYTSEGWNPTQDTSAISIADPDLVKALSHTSQLYYYGTGIESPIAKKKGLEIFQTLIAPNGQIEIATDIMAASRALLGNDEGIACIMGTGSNAVYYNGETYMQKIPSLGYLMSDEASGFNIGRSIVQLYFYDKMPKEVRSKFESQYSINKTTLLDHLYQKAKPNIYLSSFTPFIQQIDHAWKDDLLNKEFNLFIENRILCYKNFLSVPIGFVGSIAHHFRDHLIKACQSYQIESIQIIDKPIDQLIKFHLND